MADLLKEKVFWTRKMNLKLVKFMKRNPHIWDPKHPKYTSISHREHTYAEFAKKYDQEFSGRAVKDRWTNIRSTFSSYLRKWNTQKHGEPRTINWPLWEACQFLLKTKGNGQDEEQVKSDEGEESNDNQESTLEEYENLEVSKHSKYGTKLSCQNIANNLVAIFQNMQNDAFGLNNTRNGNVGRMVSEKLSQMQSYDAAKLSLKIMEVLVKYDPNNPDTSDDFNFYDE